MRFRAGDPGSQSAEVTLEGQRITGCTALDTEEGWVEIVACDDAGRPLVDGDEIRTERLYGRVTLEISE